MVEIITQEPIRKRWLNIEKYNIFKLLLSPFAIYFRQFIQFILVSLIPELIIFGIFWEVEITFTYDFVSGLFIYELNFRDEFAQALLIPLMVLTVILLILRSALVTTISWKTISDGKVNPAWAISHTFKFILQIFLTAALIIVFLLVPGVIFLLAILIGASMPGFMWILIAISVGIPLVLGSRICLFNVGVTKDSLPVGTAFQKSWYLTSSMNWMKTILLVVIFATIAIIFPWGLTSYLNNTVGQWTGLVMIVVRAALYPLFDIILSVIYIHSEYEKINKSVFREDIIKQKQQSEKLYRY